MSLRVLMACSKELAVQAVAEQCGALQLRTFLQFALDTHLEPARVWPLKRFAIKWHTLFGLALAVGIAAPQWLGIVA